MTAAIRLHDLTVGYPRRPAAVRRVSGAFAAGSLTALVGPNGGGKTTLLKAVVGLLRPDGGRVEVAPAVRRAGIGYLPQQAEIDRTFPVSVLDLVQLGHWRRVGPFGGIGRDERRRAHAALDRVGMAGVAGRGVGTLSAGQLQRALFARLMVEDCPTVLLDEPFAAVDARTTADLIEVVRGWHAAGRTVVAVLHDLAQARAHFPETLVLAGEAIAWGPTAAALTPGSLARAWRLPSGWDEARAPSPPSRVGIPA